VAQRAQQRVEQGNNEYYTERGKKKKSPDIAAYLYAVLLANTKTIREVLRMDRAEEITLEEVLEEAGLTAKWEARGVA
jgi:hypothetical protein